MARVWRSRRALRLHVTAAFAVALCLALGWWQLRRALSGNELSWVYTAEWPLFAGVALVGWWVLLGSLLGDHRPLEVHGVHLEVGGATFDRLAYDTDADLLYLRVGADVAGAQVLDTWEGHRVRFDQGGHLVGLTLAGLRRGLERDGAMVVAVPRQDGASPIEIHAAGLVSELPAGVPSVASALTPRRFRRRGPRPATVLRADLASTGQLSTAKRPQGS